ncbi:MAG: cache domain-containing protein [Candidatus Levybacteria bacterium]|nr:cache domain-containing protein [Candidatus Levybacteria bacterium]
MWFQFFLINLHFAINITAALIFFAVFWLYFDAWVGRKRYREFIRFSGFLALSISFILSGLYIESSVLSVPIFSQDLHMAFLIATRLIGYIFIILALFIDPLMQKPKHQSSVGLVLPLGIKSLSISFVSFLFPVLSALAGFLYLKRATVGLEDHLKPVAFSFFLLSLSELLALGYMLRESQNSTLYAFVAPYSILWMIQSGVILLAVIVLRKWIFFYLLKRIQSQLFMIFVSFTVALFLLITLVFSALLLKNIESEALVSLTTDVNVLEYAINSKKAEVISDAQVIALNPEVIDAIDKNNKSKLKSIAISTLLAKKQSVVTILSGEGVVLARGDDPERIGDSLSGDVLVKKAVGGEDAVSVITKDGVLAPTVSIRSAVPVRSGKDIVGVIMVGADIDNAFVDGVKETTGLNASIYADNIRSATTFIAPDGKSRWVGVKEESEVVKKQVILQGKLYAGSLNVLNVAYLTAILPLKDIDNNVVGMLFVGREQVSLLQAAGRSIELTFLVAVVLLVLSIIPAYFISRYISNQLK